MLQYLKTHLFYVLLIAAGLLFFHSWLPEHDRLLQAVQSEKVAKDHAQELQKQFDDFKAQSERQKAQTRAIVAQAKTPEQVVQAIPRLTNMPLHARTLPGVEVAVNGPELTAVLGSLKETTIDLTTCRAEVEKDKAIITDKDKVIEAYKKPKGFWKRLSSNGKMAVAGYVALRVAEVVLRGKL